MSHRSRNVSAQRKNEEIVFFVFECLADAPVYEIVDESRRYKRNRASEKDVPRSAEGVVKCGVDYAFASFNVRFAPSAGNDGHYEQNERNDKIDKHRKHGNLICRFRSEMLCHHVHGEKRCPRNENPCVKRKPVYVQIYAFVGEQVHHDDCYDEYCHDGRRHTAQKRFELEKFVFDFVFHLVSFAKKIGRL